MKIKLFRRTDLIVLLALFLACAILFVFFLPTEKGRTVTVTYKGEVIDTFLLLGEKEERRYTLAEGEVTLLVSATDVRVTSSPCTGQNCVHTAPIDRAGEAVVCLPLGFSVTLSGESETDGITG